MNDDVLKAFIAAASMAIGGVALKVTERWLARGAQRLGETEKLWTESRALRGELTRLDAEVDTWRTKYFELTAKYTDLLGECGALRQEGAVLRAEMAELRDALDRRGKRTRATDYPEGVS